MPIPMLAPAPVSVPISVNVPAPIHQRLEMRTRLGTTHPTLTNFEKNPFFDLRPDLARSWVRPGDWRPRNAILSTFWYITFLLI